MAVSTFVGFFLTGTAAAGNTVVVTGVGFQPKFVIFWWSGTSSTTDTVQAANQGHMRGVGFATSSSSRRMCVTQSDDEPTTMATDCSYRTDCCIGEISISGGTPTGLMDFQSMDSDGFTLVVDDAFVTTRRIHYLAVGGDDITNVFCGTLTEPAAAGTQNITGVGFQPDAIFTVACAAGTGSPPINAVTSRLQIGISTRVQGANYTWTGGSADAVGTCQAASYCRGTDESFTALNSGITAVDSRGKPNGWNSDGFDIDWDERTSGVSERDYFFLAIKGGQHFAGDLTTATNTTAFGETGVGFEPKAVMFLSHCLAQSTADTIQETTGDYWSMGAVDEALNQGCHASLDDDAATVAEVAIGVEHDSVYLSISTADAKDGGMTVNSLDSDGMTLQMNDADPSGKFVWYWAIGNDAGQTVSPGGIASEEAFGTAQLNRDLITSSVSPAEAFGNATMVMTVTPGGVPTAEQFGLSQLDFALLLASIASAENFPNPTVLPGEVSVSPGGVATAEAFGTPTIDQTTQISPGSIASAENFPNPTVSPGEVNVSPSSIASLEAFGTCQLNRDLLTQSIPSAEQHGTPQLDFSLLMTSVPSAEQHGTAQLNRDLLTASIPSTETFGSHTVSPGEVSVLPSSITSLEAFGSAVIDVGGTIINANGIPSEEAFGTLSVNFALLMAAIASLEAFGTPTMQLSGPQTITAEGVPTAEAFGDPTVSPGNVNVSPDGVPTQEAFGAHSLNLAIQAAGVPSTEVFGVPVVALTITPSGIVTAENFGTARLDQQISALAIPGAEQFGLATFVFFILPSGVTSAEQLGEPTITQTGPIVSPSGIPGAEEFGVAVVALENILVTFAAADITVPGLLIATATKLRATAETPTPLLIEGTEVEAKGQEN